MSSTNVEKAPVNFKPKNDSLMKRIVRDRFLFLLFTPTLLYLIIFKYIPMFGIMIAFKKYNLFTGVWASDWVGLHYFKMFLSSHNAFEIIRNTFLLGFYKLVFGFPAPIMLALMLNELRMVIYKRFVQTVSYLPHFISTVVVAGMVTMFLKPPTGMINQFIGYFGFEPINFLMQADWFRTVYITSEIWQDVGWGSIIYLAALTAVDPQLYEASEIDGANRWKKMWHVTIPGIAPAIVILFILNIGRILDEGFEKVFLLQNPATYETADIISTFVYRSGIVQGNFSYGTAVDVFMGIISFTLVYGANTISRKLGETSLW